MRTTRFICLISIALCMAFSAAARADSPITSTPFSEAYMDIEIVQRAAASGVIDGDIAAYLSSPDNPIDVKAAVVNALSWKFEGRNNAELFTWYLALKYRAPLDKLNNEILSPDELFCLGYMTVMDDYFNPNAAIPILEAAAEAWAWQANTREPVKAVQGGSFTIAIILALTRAQVAMDADWCDMWRLIEIVLDNDSLQRDMRPEALDIILEYMNSYEAYCQ